MNSSHKSEPWQHLVELLRADSLCCHSVRADASAATTCSLLDALGNQHLASDSESAQAGSQLKEGIESIIARLEHYESIGRCPIVAITGLLNAGKSSLLATYLSAENRARVLRGVDNRAGTHRFVLWLPKVWWDDRELLTVLVDFLTQVFGHPPERLSEDPAIAAQQYRGQLHAEQLVQAPTEADTAPAVDPLSIPLVAYDGALDHLQLGLVDCPDIQTGIGLDGSGSSTRMPSMRREQLTKIGRVCSAFLIVSKLSSLHDDALLQVLTSLRDAMPGIPRILAVNKVKSRYSPAVVHEQTGSLRDRFGIQSVFAAYDFRSKLGANRIPSPPAELNNQEKSLPIFFEIGGNNDKAADSPDDLHYLLHLSSRLDVGALARECSRSLNSQLSGKTEEALTWLQLRIDERRNLVVDAWRAVADACYEFMAERDENGRAIGLRLQASPAIVAQMAESLERTAPYWMRLSLRIDKTARQLHQAVANSAARIKILQNASDSVRQFAKKFRRGEGAQVVTPQRLVDAIRQSDRFSALQRLDDDYMLNAADTAMKRFAKEDQTQLNQEELDSWSSEIWQSMSLKDKLRRGTQPLAIVMAPLLAVVLVPIDGGGSAILVFASAKELLAAAGVAAVLGPMATGRETVGLVQRETPWRQLGDLFALLCDSLGIGRPAPSQLPSTSYLGQPRQLPASSLEIQSSQPSTHVAKWELADDIREQLRSAILHLRQTET